MYIYGKSLVSSNKFNMIIALLVVSLVFQIIRTMYDIQS